MEAVSTFVPVLNNAWSSFYRTIFIQEAILPATRTLNQKATPLLQKGSKVETKVSLSIDSTPLSGSISNWSELYTPGAEEMKKVFDCFDENRDGLICAKDLSLFMKKLGFTLAEEEIRSMLRSVDRNKDDLVDFEEFFSLYTTLCGDETVGDEKEDCSCGDSEEALREAFSLFDKDNDGYISATELQRVLLNLGLCEGKSILSCQRMIQRVDVDGNGQVDFNEFKVMMCSTAFQV